MNRPACCLYCGREFKNFHAHWRRRSHQGLVPNWRLRAMRYRMIAAHTKDHMALFLLKHFVFSGMHAFPRLDSELPARTGKTIQFFRYRS